MVLVPWSLVSDLRSLALDCSLLFDLWYLVYDLSSLVFGPRSLFLGLRSLIYSLSSLSIVKVSTLAKN